ncbi:MAG: hydrogen peroxide-dependent heme synthase, partial [Mycobacterium sp.]
MAKLDYESLNATIRYLMFSVFSVRQGALGVEDGARAAVI